MSYSLTTAASIDDVISQVCQYAVDHAGFNMESTVKIAGWTTYRISKGGIFWAFRAFAQNASQWRISASMTESLIATDTSDTVGQYQPTHTSLWNFVGPYPSLYLFSEGTCVHMVLEVTTGVFTHMSFGSITKTDTFEGGEYISGNFVENRVSNSSTGLYESALHYYNSPIFMGDTYQAVSSYMSYIRNVMVNPTRIGSNYAVVGGNQNTEFYQRAGLGGYHSICESLLRDSPNAATLRTPIFPLYVTLKDISTGLRVLSGYVPNARVCSMKFLDAGEVILSDWIVFPCTSKQMNNANYSNSENYGIAYKRVP